MIEEQLSLPVRKYVIEEKISAEPMQGYQAIKLLAQGAEAEVYLIADMVSGQFRVLKKSRNNKRQHLEKEFKILEEIKEKGDYAHVVEPIKYNEAGIFWNGLLAISLL